MTIEKLQISNFQKHEKLRIQFDPQVTTIVGPNDSGKSAIVRALRWLMLNDLRGDAFIREGQKQCSVKAQVAGRRVSRSRGKTNSYQLDDRRYDAVRSDVPQSVEQFLSVNDVNFQSQHAPHFWFSLTAGEVARELHSVIDLTVIDDALDHLGKAERKAKARVTVSQERLETAKQQAEELTYVTQLDEELCHVEETHERYRRARDRADILSTACADALDQRDRVKQLRSCTVDAGRVLAAAGDYQEAAERYQSLFRTRNAAQQARVRAVVSIPDLAAVEVAHEKAQEAQQTSALLRVSLSRVRDARLELDQVKKQLALQAERLSAVDACPLCGQVMQEVCS